MDNSRLRVGYIAEHVAREFLKKKGYRILESNYRKPWGEIDIVAECDGVLHFVEVKSNSIDLAGFEPELRADRSKLLKVARTAETYLKDKSFSIEQEWGIDVVSVTFKEDGGVGDIRYFENVEF